MSQYTYVGIFSCPQLQSSFAPAIVHPAKVDLITGTEKIRIFRRRSRVHPIGLEHPAMVEEELQLPKNKKLLRVSVQSKEGNLKLLEEMLNIAITKLAVLMQPQLFFDVIYKGPIAGSEKKLGAMSVRPAERTMPTREDIAAKLAARPIPGLQDRFSLMSEFYARSLDYDPSPEKFILLWTVLEIYPMTDTSNIAPVRKLLSSITGDDKDIERNFDIGRLYGRRCSIVHDGKFDVATSSPDFTKLELLLHEVFRRVLNLPYGGLLDRFKTAQ